MAPALSTLRANTLRVQALGHSFIKRGGAAITKSSVTINPAIDLQRYGIRGAHIKSVYQMYEKVSQFWPHVIILEFGTIDLDNGVQCRRQHFHFGRVFCWLIFWTFYLFKYGPFSELLTVVIILTKHIKTHIFQFQVCVF